MKRALLPRLACLSCRTGYELTEHQAAGDDVLSGFLTCRSCAIVVPIVRGFPLFTEPRLHAGQADPASLAVLEARLFGTEESYREYRRRKLERRTLEIYAAFQPFNESTRAFEPVIPSFESRLRPGDVILDPWCRSGWTALWLAELFPDQTVVACWEGETSVLGYRGFGHWFAHGRRPANLEILFVHPERGLPFADGAFAGVYALDAFHRFTLTPFAGDVLRVARPDAVIALAHLHLTNSEPEPYFDRGGFMWHGLDYRAWLDQIAARQGRKARVFSEIDLFRAEDGTLPAEHPRTGHYNGFVLIEPATAGPLDLKPHPPSPDHRWLVNPLFRIVVSRRLARVDASLHNGMTGELLERHPIYQARLPDAPVELSDPQFALLALAATGACASQIAATLNLTPDALAAIAAPLEGAELLRPTGASSAATDLQRFHANQLPAVEPEAAFSLILDILARQAAPAIRTSEGAMTGQEADLGLRSFHAYLRQAGLRPGDSLVLADSRSPLSFLLVLAGLALGLDVILDSAPAPADPVIQGRDGRKSMTVEGGASDVIMDWIAGHPDPQGLKVVTDGSLTLPVDGVSTRFSASHLAEAALSLEPFIEVHPDPIEGFGGLFGLLTALSLAAGSRCMTFRA